VRFEVLRATTFPFQMLVSMCQATRRHVRGNNSIHIWFNRIENVCLSQRRVDLNKKLNTNRQFDNKSIGCMSLF